MLKAFYPLFPFIIGMGIGMGVGRIPWIEQGTYCATYSCSANW